jgi:hypothetical protein
VRCQLAIQARAAKRLITWVIRPRFEQPVQIARRAPRVLCTCFSQVCLKLSMPATKGVTRRSIYCSRDCCGLRTRFDGVRIEMDHGGWVRRLRAKIGCDRPQLSKAAPSSPAAKPLACAIARAWFTARHCRLEGRTDKGRQPSRDLAIGFPRRSTAIIGATISAGLRHGSPLVGTARGELNDAAQAALPFCCLIKASARFANSCGGTSSMCVAINQLFPEGSCTLPLRSP